MTGYKRLEKQRFPWPTGREAVVSLSGAQLNLLLDGYDIWRLRPHRTLHYTAMI